VGSSTAAAAPSAAATAAAAAAPSAAAAAAATAAPHHRSAAGAAPEAGGRCAVAGGVLIEGAAEGLESRADLPFLSVPLADSLAQQDDRMSAGTAAAGTGAVVRRTGRRGTAGRLGSMSLALLAGAVVYAARGERKRDDTLLYGVMRHFDSRFHVSAQA